MAKQLLASGSIKVNVYKNTFINDDNDEIEYFNLEIPLDDETGLTEIVKLKGKASYVCLVRKLNGSTSSSGSNIKLSKPTE